MNWRPTSFRLGGRKLFDLDLQTALASRFEEQAAAAAEHAFSAEGRINRRDLRRAIIEQAMIDPLGIGEPEYCAARAIGSDDYHTQLQCWLPFTGDSVLLRGRSQTMILERSAHGWIEEDGILVEVLCNKLHLSLSELALKSEVELIKRHVAAQRSEVLAYNKELTEAAIGYVSENWAIHAANRKTYQANAMFVALVSQNLAETLSRKP